MDVSLIITTCNWLEALKATLHSVLRQSMSPGEVIIADDGSGAKTDRVIEEVPKPSDLRWFHVWHSGRGIQQARRIGNIIEGLQLSKGRRP